MTPPPVRVWRVFPWDPQAAVGAPFSPEFVPAIQGQGRFDLPAVPGDVLYVAETPEHAVAETIQRYRGQWLSPPDLCIAGHDLALVSLNLPSAIRRRITDLCDPAVLVRLGLRPDATASSDRKITQRMAADAHAAGAAGLRWWSALTGDWHMVVLFRDRLDPPVEHDEPEVLTMESPALIAAAKALGIPRTPRRRS